MPAIPAPRTPPFIREHNQAARPFKWRFRGLSAANRHIVIAEQRRLLGHEQIVAQAYGRHLLIKRLDDEEPNVVARLADLSRNRDNAAFRNHRGRWQPLSGTGSLDKMTEVVVTLLQP